VITSQLPDTIKQHKETTPDHLRFSVALVSTTRYNELAKELPSTDKTLDMVEPLLSEKGHVLARREILRCERGHRRPGHLWRHGRLPARHHR
jgi:molybdopterin biosynthesis enzyme MoaB